MTDFHFLPAGGPRAALFGATGLVGQFLLEGLTAREFPLASLALFASPRSAGKALAFREETLRLRAPESLEPGEFDLVFFAATGALSLHLAPRLATEGALVVDKSATFRLDPAAYLMIPELALAPPPRAGIVASPNCTTVVLALALEPLRRAAGLARVTVTSLQAASGAGRTALEELQAQRADPTAPAPVFGERLEGNVLPLCDALDAEGWSGEERKLERETRRLLGLPDLCLEATCTRVPVAIGHGLSVVVETERALDVREAAAALEAFPGLAFGEGLPTPLSAAGEDRVHVGRLRSLGPRRLAFFAVGDNLRKGAATNALQIAEAWWQAYRPGARGR